MLDLEGFDDLAGIEPEPDQTIIDRLRFDSELDMPWQMCDIDIWKNYCDEDLYHLDKAVRGYLLRTRWKRLHKGQLRTAVPLVFQTLFGRKAKPTDCGATKKMHVLMRYYCTRFTGKNKIGGNVHSTVYIFSKYAVIQKRPYSMRLRLEERNDERAFIATAHRYDPENKGPKSRRGNLPDGVVDNGRSSLPQRG